MKIKLHRIFYGIITTGMLLSAAGTGFAGDSLYEYYTDTPLTTLKQETSEMGRELKEVFGQHSLSGSQQQIDFSEYYSNLRRLVVYAAKLAAYSEYEKDLGFARDHEVFKGLPDALDPQEKKGPQLDRKEFIKNKYIRLNKNIAEEIDTYKDLILLSLDACETLADNDISEFSNSQKHQRKVKQFMQSKEYGQYASGKNRFNSRWPELASRIDKQLTIWAEKPLSPDTPLIDRAITEAL